MKCPYCNNQIPDGSVFCDKCGQPIQSDKQTGLDSDKYWEKENLEKQKEVSRVREMQVAQRKRKKRQRKTVLLSLIGLAILAGIIVYSIVYVPQIRYNDALELLESGEYEEARRIFVDLGNYENAEDLILQCDAGITENNYQDALQVFNSGDYSAALQKFIVLNDYAESQQYALDCEIQLLSHATVNETVVFGAHNWTVLEKSDSNILLVSENYVANKIANEYDVGQYGKYRCWSESTLRTWLNSSFISEVFSTAEAKLLIKKSISTPEFNVSGYDGWNEEEITVTTEDKVYIPSKEDVERYNIRPIEQKSTNNYYNNSDDSAGWLRDRGHGIAFQSTLNSDGSYGSEWHFYSSYGVRAIIRVSLTGGDTNS